VVPWTGRIKRYQFSGIAFNSSNVTRTITGPKDKAGYLWDYGVQTVTTTFAGASSTPMMEVGISGTLAKYGVAYDFGTLSTTGGSKSPRTDLQTDASTWASAAFTNPVIAKNTIVYLTFIAATGGGAAGVADMFCEIIWAD
jgi:hypothetical protein